MKPRSIGQKRLDLPLVYMQMKRLPKAGRVIGQGSGDCTVNGADSGDWLTIMDSLVVKGSKRQARGPASPVVSARIDLSLDGVRGPGGVVNGR